MAVSQLIGGAVVVAVLIDPRAELDDAWLAATTTLITAGVCPGDAAEIDAERPTRRKSDI